MIKKINNKGFTLVEVLAVLVILSIIMAIAIPSITSSLERSKEKQDESKYKMLESFAEIYVADHKNAIYKNLGESYYECWIDIDTLKNGGYLIDDANIDSNNEEIVGGIHFNRQNNSYTYKESRPNRIGNCLN